MAGIFADPKAINNPERRFIGHKGLTRRHTASSATCWFNHFCGRFAVFYTGLASEWG